MSQAKSSVTISTILKLVSQQQQISIEQQQIFIEVVYKEIESKQKEQLTLAHLNYLQQYEIYNNNMDEMLNHIGLDSSPLVIKHLLESIDIFKITSECCRTIESRFKLLFIYPEYYHLVESLSGQLTLRSQIKSEFLLVDEQQKYILIDLYCLVMNYQIDQKLLFYTAIRTKQYDLIDLDHPEFIFKQNQIQSDDIIETVVGDSLTDIYYPVVSDISYKSDVQLIKCLKQYFSYNNARQKILDNLSGSFVYDGCTFSYEDEQIQSLHGANFHNQICPFQIIISAELIQYLDTFDQGVVLKSIQELLQDDEFIVLAADYQTLLYLVFSKYGYFQNEKVPENEDWGNVQISDYQSQTVKNKIPIRKICKQNSMQQIKNICTQIIISCLSKSSITESEAAERQEVACTYFLSISTQLLINRPSFLLFIMTCLEQFGEKIDQNTKNIQHMVNVNVIDVLLKYIEFYVVEKQSEDPINIKAVQAVYQFLKTIILNHSCLIESLIEQQALRRLFRVLEKINYIQTKFRQELIVTTFKQLDKNVQLYNKLINNLDSKQVDEILLLLDNQIQMNTQIVILQQCVLNNKIAINEQSFQIVSKTVQVPATYMDQLLKIYKENQDQSLFIKIENQNQIIYQPLLFYHVILEEKDVKRVEQYYNILQEGQNTVLIEQLPIEFFNLVLSQSEFLPNTIEMIFLKIVSQSIVFNPFWLNILLKKFAKYQEIIFQNFTQMLGNSKYFSIIDMSRGIITVDWGQVENEFMLQDQIIFTMKYQINGITENHTILMFSSSNNDIITITHKQREIYISINNEIIQKTIIEPEICLQMIILSIDFSQQTININAQQTKFYTKCNGYIKHIRIGQFSSNIGLFLHDLNIQKQNLKKFDLNPIDTKPATAHIEQVNIRSVQKFNYHHTYQGIIKTLISNFELNPNTIMWCLRYWVQQQQNIDDLGHIYLEQGLDMEHNKPSDFNNYFSLCQHDVSFTQNYILNMNRYFTQSEFQRLEKTFDLGINDKLFKFMTSSNDQDEKQILLMLMCDFDLPLDQQPKYNIAPIQNLLNKVLNFWSDAITKDFGIDLIIQLIIKGCTSFQLMTAIQFIKLYSNEINLKFDKQILSQNGVQNTVKAVYQYFCCESLQYDGTINWILGKNLEKKLECQHTQYLFVLLIILNSYNTKSKLSEIFVSQFLEFVYFKILTAQLDIIDYILLDLICQHDIAYSLIKCIKQNQSEVGFFIASSICCITQDEQKVGQILDLLSEQQFSIQAFGTKHLVTIMQKTENTENIEKCARLMAFYCECCYQNNYDQFKRLSNLVVQLFFPLNVQLQDLQKQLSNGLNIIQTVPCNLLKYIFYTDNQLLFIRKNILERHINLKFFTAIEYLGMKGSENLQEINDVLMDIQMIESKQKVNNVCNFFIIKEVERISQMYDLLEKTEQTIRLLILMEGFVNKQLGVKLFKTVRSLVTPQFMKYMTQMDARKHEINEKLNEVIPFKFPIESEFAKYHLYDNYCDGIKERQFMHLIIALEGKELFEYLFEYIPSKIRLNKQQHFQLLEHDEPDFILKLVEIKKEYKVNNEEAKHVQRIFSYLLLAFNITKLDQSKLILGIYVYRLVRAYKNALNEYRTNSTEQMSAFTNDIFEQNSFNGLKFLIEYSQISQDMNKEIFELLEQIQWDFKGKNDTNIYVEQLMDSEVTPSQLTFKNIELFKKFSLSKDVRSLRECILKFNQQKLNQLQNKFSAKILVSGELVELFVFKELYLIYQTKIVMVSKSQIQNAQFGPLNVVIIELSGGESIILQLDQNNTSLRQFLADKQIYSQTVDELHQQWIKCEISNLQFLIQLSKLANYHMVVLPKLVLQGQKVDEDFVAKKQVWKFDSIGNELLSGLYQYQFDVEQQQNIPIRDLRVFMEHQKDNIQKFQNQEEYESDEFIVNPEKFKNPIQKDKFDLIIQEIKLLSSPYVTNNLHYWLDLVYGPKQYLGVKKLSSLKFLPQLYDKPFGIPNKEFQEKLGLLPTSYTNYEHCSTLLFGINEEKFVFNLNKQNCKPEKIQNSKILMFKNTIYYCYISQLNIFSVFNQSNVLQFQFKLPGQKASNIYCSENILYLLSDQGVISYQIAKLFENNFEIDAHIYQEDIQFIDEFEFEKSYVFIQTSNKCYIYYKEQLISIIDQVMNKSQLFISQHRKQQFTGCGLFDYRENLIQESIEKAKGHTDAWVSVGKLFVRGIKIYYFE